MDANITHRIAQLREELTTLEAQAALERENTLRSLPAAAGVSSIDELIELLLPYSSRYRGKRGASPRRKTAAPKAASPEGVKKAGKRTRLSDDQKKALIEDITAGGLTGVQAAKKYGVSVMTVQNIKKAAGLVNPRSK